MNLRLAPFAFVVLATAVTPILRADVVPASLFCDHAVLQQGMPIPVWGTADENEKVTVSIDGQKAHAVAHGGRWSVRLPALPAGGPYTLTIEGHNRIEISDVLVGEVWLCSGQSNMERQLGPREGQKPIKNWEQEAATADFPQIRHFGVAQKFALEPATKVEGSWVVCTPKTAPDFTAIGFFFGRAIHQDRKVPIGLIHSSWGGTPAEAWTSAKRIATLPDFDEPMRWLKKYGSDPEAGRVAYERQLNDWFVANDAGAAPAHPWSAADLEAAGWSPMNVPGYWENSVMPGFDGLVWFRYAFEVPATWAGKAVDLHLGAVDDQDTTWVNGQKVGSTAGWNTNRVYHLAPGVLKPGRNTIAVRVLDTGGNGGIWDNHDALRLVCVDDATAVVPLHGQWQYRVSVDFSRHAAPPANLAGTQNAPTMLYNAMIAPLQPYAIRGVIWYQGEANAGNPKQYRTLFPAMVADWREAWGEGSFPFLYVQIAPFKDMPPEIREAQLLSLPKISNSAMAVTLDVGDAVDIHPADKRPVGERLALAARALAYGEKLEYSGPLYREMSVSGGKVVLRFTHVGTGLIAREGELKGFVIAGGDGAFRSAKAVIVGDTVEVSADGIVTPTAVRYAWANAPEGNLFNHEGLPASPFRTDTQ